MRGVRIAASFVDDISYQKRSIILEHSRVT